MIKTLRNLFKQDKEKFVVPKSVQAVTHPVIHNIHFCITRDARHII